MNRFCRFRYISLRNLCTDKDVLIPTNSAGNLQLICPVGWGSKTHRLFLCRGVRPSKKYSGYDTKQSDGEVLVMLELWGIRSTSSLPSLRGPLWPGMVALDWVYSIGQIELNSLLILN